MRFEELVPSIAVLPVLLWKSHAANIFHAGMSQESNARQHARTYTHTAQPYFAVVERTSTQIAAARGRQLVTARDPTHPSRFWMCDSPLLCVCSDAFGTEQNEVAAASVVSIVDVALLFLLSGPALVFAVGASAGLFCCSFFQCDHEPSLNTGLGNNTDVSNTG